LLREIVALLDETYCRHLGVELAHIHDSELRGWLQQRMESTRNRVRSRMPNSLHLLGKITEAEVFEHFLQAKFLAPSASRWREAESLVPIVDRIIDRAAHGGVTQIVIGMAHRGRSTCWPSCSATAAGDFAESSSGDPV